MSGVTFAIPLVTLCYNALNLQVINNNLMSILLLVMSPQLALWIDFQTPVQINTSHLILQIW
jgi:hypothetical protein